MPLSSIFQATQNLLQELEKMAIKFNRPGTSLGRGYGQMQVNFFSSQRSIAQSLMASANGLQKRIHGVLNLVRSPDIAHQKAKLKCESLRTL